MTALLDSPLAGAVLDAAVRGTFILLAALGATTLMRRTSASARHLVWLAALTALMLLPLARRFVPEWRVLPVPSAVLVAPTDDLASVLDPAALDQVAPTAGVAGVAAPSAVPSIPQPVRIPSDWKRLALLAWAAGAALFALRLAYGLVRVWWMERRAVELTDEEWVRLTDGLSRRLRLGRIVRLLRGPGATVPMTWGIFHPVILLPGEADGWESERRRVVLAHELAHVRRWDALTQWIAHVALVVYWFNPLVWMAVRKLREEREHACDDAVLEIGTAPADYADHLLTIVRSLGSAPGPAPAHALAMARRSQFEGRLLAILDNAVRRNGVSRAAALATSAAALACLVPLAAMRPADRTLAVAAQGEETAAKPASPMARLANRVEEAVQKVTGTQPEGDEGRVAALDAAASIGKTASALRAEPGSGTVTLPGTVGPVGTVSLSTSGFAGLLRVLETGTDPGLYADIIRAVEEIGSSSDRRVVLERLLGKSDLSHDNVVAIIAATRTMASDTDKRVVLERAVRHRALRANPLPHVFYDAMRTFTSSTDQRVVLSSLLEARRLDPACLELLFQHVSRLKSSSDQRVVLTDAVRTQRIEGHAREAFLAAARTMDSDTDRRVALSALMDRDEASAADVALTDDGARVSLSASGEVRTEPATGSTRNSTTRTSESTEAVWDSDIVLELAGRDIEIHAKHVVFGRGRWDIRRIRPGGNLVVQETRGGVVRRLRAVPGEGGRPVYTYTVDGRARTFDPGARSWFEAVVREFTGD